MCTMRTLVDKNKERCVGVYKLTNNSFKRGVYSYQLEDLSMAEGREGRVISNHNTLNEAREALDI